MTTKRKRGRPIAAADRAKVAKLRQQGMTFAAIGLEFDPPRSANRIGVMLRRAQKSACNPSE